MAKLSKQYYITSKGEKKINCYHINISRGVVDKTNITNNDEVKIYAHDNKIIIEKA
jgi:hypothetical protein